MKKFLSTNVIIGSVKSYAQICFGIWQKSITGGRLNRPLVTITAGRAQRVKGGGTPLVLPLTLCGLAAITQPEARPSGRPDASCSCISCCPTGFRLHDAAWRRPASMPNFHPGRHRLLGSCAGSPGSSAR